jgi:hypothetical protein
MLFGQTLVLAEHDRRSGEIRSRLPDRLKEGVLVHPETTGGVFEGLSVLFLKFEASILRPGDPSPVEFVLDVLDVAATPI